MITDPSTTSSAELQNPTLNREDVLKRKPINSESEIPQQVDLNSYSKETLNDKSKLEKNPACLIHIEKDSENTLVRNQIIIKDESGNEVRTYVYNVVNKDNVFAAEVTGFVPGEYDADKVDSEIALFLKKGINTKEQIEDIKDARVAVLAGVISRKDYKDVEFRLSQKQPEEKIQEPQQLKKETPGEQNSFERDAKVDKQIEIANQNLDLIENKINFMMGELSTFDSSVRRLEGDFLDLNFSNRELDTSIGFAVKTYENFIAPTLTELNQNLSKNINQELNDNKNIVRSEITKLKDKISSSTDSKELQILNEQLQNLTTLQERIASLINKRANALMEYQMRLRKVFELFNSLDEKKFFTQENKDKVPYLSRIENKKNEFYQFLEGIREI